MRVIDLKIFLTCLILLIFCSSCTSPAENIEEYYKKKGTCIESSAVGSTIAIQYAKGNYKPIKYYIRCMLWQTFGDDFFPKKKSEEIENRLSEFCLEHMKNSSCSNQSLKTEHFWNDCQAPWKECEEHVDDIFIDIVINKEIRNAKNKFY